MPICGRQGAMRVTATSAARYVRCARMNHSPSFVWATGRCPRAATLPRPDGDEMNSAVSKFPAVAQDRLEIDPGRIHGLRHDERFIEEIVSLGGSGYDRRAAEGDEKGN